MISAGHAIDSPITLHLDEGEPAEPAVSVRGRLSRPSEDLTMLPEPS